MLVFCHRRCRIRIRPYIPQCRTSIPFAQRIKMIQLQAGQDLLPAAGHCTSICLIRVAAPKPICRSKGTSPKLPPDSQCCRCSARPSPLLSAPQSPNGLISRPPISNPPNDSHAQDLPATHWHKYRRVPRRPPLQTLLVPIAIKIRKRNAMPFLQLPEAA